MENLKCTYAKQEIANCIRAQHSFPHRNNKFSSLNTESSFLLKIKPQLYQQNQRFSDIISNILKIYNYCQNKIGAENATCKNQHAKRKISGIKKTVFDCIHQSLITAFQIQDWDRFQRIEEFDKCNFEIPEGKTDIFITIIEPPLENWGMGGNQKC